MDTRLSYLRLPLEVYGAEIAQGRVPACGIIEALDARAAVIFPRVGGYAGLAGHSLFGLLGG